MMLNIELFKQHYRSVTKSLELMRLSVYGETVLPFVSVVAIGVVFITGAGDVALARLGMNVYVSPVLSS